MFIPNSITYNSNLCFCSSMHFALKQKKQQSQAVVRSKPTQNILGFLGFILEVSKIIVTLLNYSTKRSRLLIAIKEKLVKMINFKKSQTRTKWIEHDG